MVSKKEFNDLQEKVLQQDLTIENLQEKALQQDLTIDILLKKVNFLEKEIARVDAEKNVASHVSDILAEEADSLCQYQRRSCLILKGVPVKINESVDNVETSTKEVLTKKFGIDESTVNKDFDKAHRVGPKFGNKQDIIMRFKSHSCQDIVYKARKDCDDDALKIRPSLTKRRKDLLELARVEMKASSNFHFAFADSSGNLKIRVKKKINNKFFFKFKNKFDIANLIAIIDVDNVSYDRLCESGEESDKDESLTQ